MSTEQKRAWFVVIVCFAAVAAVLVLLALGAGWHARGGLGLFRLAALTPLLFREKRKAGEVTVDERDTAIAQKALLAGGVTSYTVFILACMVPWFVYVAQGNETIEIDVLPFTVAYGAIAFFVTKSVVTLVLYGRAGNRAQE